MSYLADLIYEVQHRLPAGSTWPLITYHQLVEQLPRSYRGLSPRQPELHAALGEIAVGCQRHAPALPVLTAVVISSKTLRPGRRYFDSAHPELQIGKDGETDWRAKKAREAAWWAEVAKVAGAVYPPRLSNTAGETDSPPDVAAPRGADIECW